MSKIVILLSTYNGAKYLQNQVASLKNQTFKEFEIIARDDGSSDDSLDILQSYDFKILESQGNIGVKASFSTLLEYALENSEAEYFMFCDQDDEWLSDKVEKTVAKMKELEDIYTQTPILVHSDLKVVDENLKVLDDSLWKFQHIDPSRDAINHLLLHNVVTGCTIMINRRLATMVTNIPKEVIMHDWWMAIVASSFGKIGFVDEPLMLYRQHSSNDTGAKNYGISYFTKKFLEKQDFLKYTLQARKFFEVYGEKLDKSTQEMIENFSYLEKMNWLEKRVLLVKHKIFKNGLMRNIGLMLRV